MLECSSAVSIYNCASFGDTYPFTVCSCGSGVVGTTLARAVCCCRGLVTYREVDLLVDPAKASSQQRQRVCTVVTHEVKLSCSLP